MFLLDPAGLLETCALGEAEGQQLHSSLSRSSFGHLCNVYFYLPFYPAAPAYSCEARGGGSSSYTLVNVVI